MPYIHSTEKAIRGFILKTLLGPFELLIGRNYSVENTTANEDINIFFKELQESHSGFDLIRIGESGDGSYLIPNDLEGISHCVSLGYGGIMKFEKHLANLGIQSTIVDKIVPKHDLENIYFVDKFIAPTSDIEARTVTLTDLLVHIDKRNIPAHDLILQMDIEGNEWTVLSTCNEEIYKRFRIIVIEFHSLHQLRSKWVYSKIMKPIIEKLVKNHDVVKLEINHSSGLWSLNGKDWYPDTIEITFHRRDRKAKSGRIDDLRSPSINGSITGKGRKLASFYRLMQEDQLNDIGNGDKLEHPNS